MYEPQSSQGADNSSHCEVVAHIERLAGRSLPYQSNQHDENGQAAEDPVNNERRLVLVHGYYGAGSARAIIRGTSISWSWY